MLIDLQLVVFFISLVTTLSGRTFVDICKPSDTVARVRAYLLHRLNEIGHSNHQFRLRYKGVYLRDAYTLEEYKLLNNAVIHMIPLNHVSEWNKDKRFYQSDKSEEDVDDAVQVALKSEVKLLNLREKVLKVFDITMIMQIVVAFMALFTNYWYFFFAYGLVLFLSLLFSPSFTRVSGWVGTNSVRRKEYMIGMIFLSIAILGSSIALLVLNLTELLGNPFPTPRCSIANCLSSAGSDEFQIGVCVDNQQRCYESSVWTTIYYCIVIVFMMVTCSLSAFLLHNFKFNPGDFIERYLVQTRDLSQILEAVRSGGPSQKRSAAFELATMASSADDNKFQIVTEGGLDALVTLALSSDLTTQEYASEAIAECLTIPAIQDQFVEIGGMKTLTALLNSKNPRTNHEAIVALSYVVSDSDNNKTAVVDGHGLDDLLYACKYSNASNRKILASIYLELAYFANTRSILVSRSSPSESLIHLLRRSCVHIQEEVGEEDMETIRLSLQTFELLAIEEPSLISLQEDLLPFLLSIATATVDKKIQLLATKLLLYFTQTPESCDRLCSSPELTDRFLYFAHSSEPELLKVLADISLRIAQPFKHRERLISDGFLEFLTYLQNSISDRESWNIVDQAISTLQNKEKPNEDIQKPPRPTSATSSSSKSSSTSDSSSHRSQLPPEAEDNPSDNSHPDQPSTSQT